MASATASARLFSPKLSTAVPWQRSLPLLLPHGHPYNTCPSSLIERRGAIQRRDESGVTEPTKLILHQLAMELTINQDNESDNQSVSIQRKAGLYQHRLSLRNHNMICKVLRGEVKLEDGADDEACELVNGVELVIGEGQDSSIHAYLFKAVKNNNGTGVLLLSDVFGFEDSSTRDFAYRVACNGYNVLVPDIFRGNPWKKGQSRAGFEQWLEAHSPERVAKDIDLSAKWLVDEFMAARISKKLGVIGFCFGGGRLIETLARDEVVNFGTGVCFYGTRINASLAKDIKVPVLFISGDKDPLCPVDKIQEMGKSIEGSRVVIYYGRGHGFAHRPESQEEDQDAEDAFTIMRSWLQDNLLVSKDLMQ